MGVTSGGRDPRPNRNFFAVLTFGEDVPRPPRLGHLDRDLFFHHRVIKKHTLAFTNPPSCFHKSFPLPFIVLYHHLNLCNVLTMVKDPHQIRCRILPIKWTRAQFEQRHGSITTYANELIKKNSTQSIDVDKEDVVHIWWLLVDRLFPKGDPDRDQYMSQVSRVLQ